MMDEEDLARELGQVLPDDPAEEPYELRAFRVTHRHDDNPDLDGDIVLEFAYGLQGISGTEIVPIALEISQATDLLDGLTRHFRRVMQPWLCEEDGDDLDDENQG